MYYLLILEGMTESVKSQDSQLRDLGDNFVWSHHVIILVFENVAVPYIM
jgi:hypothetical protein